MMEMRASARSQMEPVGSAAAAALTIRRRRQAPLGGLLLGIASVWLAVPLKGLLLDASAGMPGLGVPGAVCAVMIGAALALLALSWIWHCETLVIDQGLVRMTERRLGGTRTWEEPLARYRGVRQRCEELPHRHGARTWYLVEAWHPEPARTVELARGKDPRLIGQCAKVWAGRLALPLCEEHQGPARSEEPTRDDASASAASARPLPAYPATTSDAQSSAA
jgi:hypothetical protein